MALEITTVGAYVKYAVETTAGTRPTTGYTVIPDVNSAPEISMTPSTIDVSNISDLVTRYTDGRIDPGGVQTMALNNTEIVKTVWATFVSAAETAVSAGKGVWMEYAFPNSQSCYFKVRPIAMNIIPGIDQNSLSTLQAPFFVESQPVWAAASGAQQ